MRVFAAGTVAMHEGLREFGDVDNGVATCEFDDGKLACFYASRTMAHGHETLTEIFGTAGRLTVGQNPRLEPRRHRRRARRAQRMHADVLRALRGGVPARDHRTSCEAVRDDRPPALTLHDATEATRIGIALRESLQTRRVVEL